MLLRALNTAVSYTGLTLAAVASIVCYGATSQAGMDAGVVFSALAFFLLLRTLLMALPAALSAIADARAALERLAVFIVASAGGATVNDNLASKRGEESAVTPSGDVVIHIETQPLPITATRSSQPKTPTHMTRKPNCRSQMDSGAKRQRVKGSLSTPSWYAATNSSASSALSPRASPRCSGPPWEICSSSMRAPSLYANPSRRRRRPHSPSLPRAPGY